MTAQIIDGKRIASEIRRDLRRQIEARRKDGLRPPGLAVIMIGSHAPSAVYVRNKRQGCAETGIRDLSHDLPAETTQQQLLDLIARLNHDPAVDGILVQLPLPAHIDQNAVIDHIDPAKDVDGFHPCNVGRLALRMPRLRPCTPFGVMKLLESTGVDLRGKSAVVVGASNIVGRPMSLELLLAGCTVTTCHRFTRDLAEQVSRAEVLVVAVGKPGFIRGEWIRPGAIVVDVGINRLDDGQLAGDVEFEPARLKAGWITPVPGGVGPMTVTMLLHNTLEAARQPR
jgi:methylenetetrahydrofolate dehydrogenase (NADP+)/methenyltetrahydrofolate cyclohydrolase